MAAAVGEASSQQGPDRQRHAKRTRGGRKRGAANAIPSSWRLRHGLAGCNATQESRLPVVAGRTTILTIPSAARRTTPGTAAVAAKGRRLSRHNKIRFERPSRRSAPDDDRCLIGPAECWLLGFWDRPGRAWARPRSDWPLAVRIRRILRAASPCQARDCVSRSADPRRWSSASAHNPRSA